MRRISLDMLLDNHKLKEITLKVLTNALQRPRGEPIIEEPWDQLIILDDCRFDMFESEFKKRHLPGELRSKLSLGSWTGEFLRKNFTKEYYPDIVYISANPFTDKYLKEKFYRMISVWKTSWDKRYNTVLPAPVYRAAVKAFRKYPDKRIIVHFLQPHHPYLTLNGEDTTMSIIRDSISKGCFKMDTVLKEPLNELYLSPIYSKFHLKKLIWAYKENLRIVMPYVELLLHNFKGISVVTADHGELFGEYVTPMIPIRVYGHGIGNNPNLRVVPWWIIRDPDRINLPSLKKIRREITIIESRFNMKTSDTERKLIRSIVNRLKLKTR